MIRSLNKRLGFKAVTLIEILTVVVILTILIGVFHRFFSDHWMVYQEKITRDQLWQEANLISERLSFDARQAESFVVTPDQKTAVLLDIDGNEISSYLINIDGTFRVRIPDLSLPNGRVETFSSNLHFVRSSFFTLNGDLLRLALTLQAPAFFRTVEVNTQMEAFSRN